MDISFVYLLAVESHDDNGTYTVNIHYVRPVVNRRLRLDTLSLQSPDPATRNLLVKALEEELTGE